VTATSRASGSATKVLGLGAAVAAGAVLIGTYTRASAELPASIAISVPLGAAGAAFVIWRWRVGAVALSVGVVMSGLNPDVFSLGTAEARLSDVFLAIAVAQAIFLPAQPSSTAARRVFRWIAAVSTIAALSLGTIASEQPDFLPQATVSLTRFIATAAITWVVYRLTRGEGDLKLIAAAIVVGSCIAITIAALEVQGGLSAALTGRYGQFFGINTIGFVSAVVLIYAVHRAHERALAVALASGIGGTVGVLLSKSVGAVVVAVLGVTVIELLRAKSGSRSAGALAVAAAVIVSSVLGFMFVQTFRPEVVPGSGDFGRSSATHRLILGTAGVDIFLGSPLLGVGWQRSSDPAVIGDPQITNRLRQSFTGGYSYFFPDVAASTVHNAYIQVLAELGLLGGFALIGLVIAGFSAGRDALSKVRGTSLAPHVALFIGWILAVLVWWNDAALFGGQPESVLAFATLGAVLRAGSLARAHRGGEDRA
jgi:O-antigen ligase